MKLFDLNSAFIDYGGLYMSKAYKRYFESLSNRVSSLDRLEKAIEDTQLKVDVRPLVVSGLILNDIQTVLTNKVDPINYILAISLLRNFKTPERIAQVVYTQSEKLYTNVKVVDGFKNYVVERANVVSRLSVDVSQNIRTINEFIKSNLSKEIIKDFSELKKQGLSDNEIKSNLREKFKDAETRIERIVNTESHAVNERIKVIMNTGKIKVWNTQGDDRVRDTPFHNGVEGQEREIIEAFQVGGISAQYPSDYSLPIEERINCRCFTTFKER